MFGFLWTPTGAFGDVGYFSSLGILPIYIMTCVALIAFIWRKRRAEFSWIFHGNCPVLAIAIMVFGLYTSLHLLPAYPENFMPFFVLGWLCVGVGWMLYLRRRNPRTRSPGDLTSTRPYPSVPTTVGSLPAHGHMTEQE